MQFASTEDTTPTLRRVLALCAAFRRLFVRRLFLATFILKVRTRQRSSVKPPSGRFWIWKFTAPGSYLTDH